MKKKITREELHKMLIESFERNKNKKLPEIGEIIMANKEKRKKEKKKEPKLTPAEKKEKKKEKKRKKRQINGRVIK